VFLSARQSALSQEENVMRASLEAPLLGHAAMRIWSEGRSNPLDWSVRTPLGSFDTRDRITWCTADGAWTAELRRSRNGRHVYLAFFHGGTYLGRYDAAGWQVASTRSRVRQLRTLQLPLRLAA
jgi:hypothetical protein